MIDIYEDADNFYSHWAIDLGYGNYYVCVTITSKGDGTSSSSCQIW